MTTTTVAEQKTEANVKKRSEVFGWIRFGLLLISIYVFFNYVIGLSIISGDSMNPTFETNDVILSSKVFNEYQLDDVVIFNNEYGFSVVKRVIGIPGDTVAIENGQVLLNGNVLEEGYINGTPDDMAAVQVTENAYFVIGDNRTPGESLDSRSEEVGLVHADTIEGKVLLSLLPFQFSIK